MPGTDGDGLEDAQEAGAANGHAPAHSVKIEKKFACKITEGNIQPQHYHSLGHSFAEEG